MINKTLELDGKVFLSILIKLHCNTVKSIIKKN